MRWWAQKERHKTLPPLPRALTEKSQQRIVEWCRQYGLLGLLPHQVESVTLYPRYRRNERLPGFFAPTYSKYVRAGTWWHQESVAEPLDAVSDKSGGRREGDLVPRTKLKKDWPGTSCVVKDLSSMTREGLLYIPAAHRDIEAWGRYFVGVHPFDEETYDYPLPYTKEFWDSYGEPLLEFVQAAKLLSYSVGWLGMTEPSRDQSEEEFKSKWDDAREVLNVLAAPTSTVLVERPDGRLAEVVESPSLLGELATSAIFELSRRQLLTCRNPECQGSFSTAAYQQLYCKPKCKEVIKKRRDREKTRERLLLAAHESGSLSRKALRTTVEIEQARRLLAEGLLREKGRNQLGLTDQGSRKAASLLVARERPAAGLT
jgi:hypothetical protein